jgi:eukaryotic-like serine/threonine-protein kinase
LQYGDIYPMAEISLARVFAGNRNRADSVASYRRFMTLWKDADQKQPLVVEALAKGK